MHLKQGETRSGQSTYPVTLSLSNSGQLKLKKPRMIWIHSNIAVTHY